MNIYDVANNDTGENCFIIIPNDKRFGDVLFISDSGTWDEAKDNEIMQVIVESMIKRIQETMEIWNDLSEEEIEEQRDKYGISKDITYYSKIHKEYGAWGSKETNIIATKNFAQDGIYNDVIEKIKGTGMIAGCGPIAVSIALTSLKLPESFVEYTENGKEATLSKIKAVWPSASSWNGKYDWNAIQNGTNNFQTAALIFDVFENMEARIVSGGVGTTNYDTKRVLDNFGLSYDFSDTDSKNIGIHLNIISSIENKCPVIVAGHIPSKPGYGHAFVLDGGKIMSRQVSTKLYTVGKTISEGIYNTYEGKDLYYHCNLGWGGSSNGWYSPDAVTSDSYECYFYVYNIKKK